MKHTRDFAIRLSFFEEPGTQRRAACITISGQPETADIKRELPILLNSLTAPESGTDLAPAYTFIITQMISSRHLAVVRSIIKAYPNLNCLIDYQARGLAQTMLATAQPNLKRSFDDLANLIRQANPELNPSEPDSTTGQP